MQFNCWLRFPNSSEIQNQASLLATALIYEAISKGLLRLRRRQDINLLEDLLDYPSVIDCLLKPPLQHRAGFKNFQEAFDFLDHDIIDSAAITEFILSCPSDLRPSVNKAMFFIDAGGDVRGDASAEIQHLAKPSVSKLKQSWVRYAAVSPFFVAAEGFDNEEFFDVLRVSPDDLASVKTADEFLEQPINPITYFGIARFCQETLLSRLDTKSKDRFHFISFPDSIETFEFDFDPMTERELATLQNYASQNFKRKSD